MNLQATNVNGRMQLDGVVVGRSIRDGVRDHGNPTRDYAPPLLETDGLGWTEREGPTWLFNSVSTPGLAWFFPTLPIALAAARAAARRTRWLPSMSAARRSPSLERNATGSVELRRARRGAARSSPPLWDHRRRRKQRIASSESAWVMRVALATSSSGGSSGSRASKRPRGLLRTLARAPRHRLLRAVAWSLRASWSEAAPVTLLPWLRLVVRGWDDVYSSATVPRTSPFPDNSAKRPRNAQPLDKTDHDAEARPSVGGNRWSVGVADSWQSAQWLVRYRPSA